MDDVVTQQDEARAPGWIPWAAALLGLGAAVSLAIRLMPDWYQVFGPYLIVDADLVLDAVTAVTMFLFPAAVLIGSGRWVAGRRWLWWAAAALTLLAVSSLVREAWFTVFAASADPSSAPSPAAWAALWLSGAATMVIGHALLAVGLWAGIGEPSAAPAEAVRVASVIIGVATAVAFLASVWTALVTPWNGIQMAALAVTGGLLLAAGYAALGAVGIAALRSMPRPAAVPELLIAGGAALGMLGGAGSWVLPLFTVGEVPDVVIGVFIALRIVSAVGLVLLTAGFAIAALDTATRDRAVAPA
jgi:hypothetical protein